MHTKTKIRVMTVATMALIAVWATDLDACSTPVFRYALERWPADYFPAVVFHRGELSAEHKRVVEIIRKAASEDGAKLSPQAEIALLRYHWPENTRELRFAIERAIAAAGMVEASRVELAHLAQLPEETRSAVGGIDDDSCTKELWQLANEIALQEGYRRGGRGTGLQKRVGEIMGVQQTQASRMYKKYFPADKP